MCTVDTRLWPVEHGEVPVQQGVIPVVAGANTAVPVEYGVTRSVHGVNTDLTRSYPERLKNGIKPPAGSLSFIRLSPQQKKNQLKRKRRWIYCYTLMKCAAIWSCWKWKYSYLKLHTTFSCVKKKKEEGMKKLLIVKIKWKLLVLHPQEKEEEGVCGCDLGC